MRKIYFILVSAGLLMVSACHKSKTTSCPEPSFDCSAILCVTHHYNFNFTLTDKINGQDLVFSASPRYTPADIKLYRDPARTNPLILQVDSANRKLQCINASEEMYLELKGGTVYHLSAMFDADGCCSSRVKDLQVNNQFVCTCCSEAISVPVQ